jgi:TorA maturation chaperone TorD
VSWAERARLRQGSYRLIGSGFAFPLAVRIEQAIQAVPVLVELGLFDYPHALSLIEYVKHVEKANLEELVSAHAAMFAVGAGPASCPPTESAWLGDPHSGDTAVLLSDLRRAYLSYGIRPRNDSTLPLDHVTVQFDVMATLCDRERERIVAGRSTEHAVRHQVEFLDHHLGNWVPLLSQTMIRIDRHPTYTALAHAAHSLVVHDRELLGCQAHLTPVVP